MKNPYISQVLPIKEEPKKQLPYGLETTADLLLEFMSRSKDEQQRDTFWNEFGEGGSNCESCQDGIKPAKKEMFYIASNAKNKCLR